MKFIFLILFTFIGTQIYSQTDTIIIKTYNSDTKVCEEYQVTLLDSIKNGYYKRYSEHGKTVSEGRYKNNEKIGVWNYYPYKDSDTGVLEVYNYDIKQELYCNDNVEYSGMPHYPGGLYEFQNDIVSHIKQKIGRDNVKKYRSKSMLVYFKIDKQSGSVTDVEIKPYKNEINDPYLEGLIISVFQNSPKWILSEKINAGSLMEFKFRQPIKF